MRLEGIQDYSAGDEFDRRIQPDCERYDPQTSLLNQKAFQDSLADLLRSHPAGREVALIWIDLVNLRREFSLWGWSATEALACRVAGTLRSVLDQEDRKSVV